MLDAILRSIVRTTVTGRRLLEWESAAQAELGAKKRSHIETYLWLAIPIAICAFAGVMYANPGALRTAFPFLLAWGLSPMVALWLNAPLIRRRDRLTAKDRRLLRGIALRTWQYFADFSTEEHNWLVPDNVREEDGIRARRISPTNLGLLLNAQLTAVDFGFITRDEFLHSTARTFRTMGKMQRERGHFLNWYDTDTLEPLSPRYVSTVDSGNLAAALIALRQGLLEQKNHPAADSSLVLADYTAILTECGGDPANLGSSDHNEDQKFWATRLERHIAKQADPPAHLWTDEQIDQLAAEAERYVAEMDFSFLLKPKRKLFHTGWNAETGELDKFEYDALASEARIASLVAIAKNDVPHTHWARLGRRVVKAAGKRALLSWSGTMFEYLMPNLWMRRYPDTLLDQTLCAVVHCQQQYAAKFGMPWGVSESACAERVDGEDYRYYAFGIPDLAANPEQQRPWVVSPYSTLLALPVAPRGAILNLEIQIERGWLSRYGFYEAADFLQGSRKESVVRIFMAHHQGMSLVALNNVLHDECMVERFHREPMIEATALLLHERCARTASNRTAAEEPAPVPQGNSRQRVRSAA